MKIYQTIHQYPPHIPIFEKRYGINDTSIITFSALQKLIIEDGYAASYILLPALQGKTDEVFFTIWDYERLQFLWADEHGITSRDLSVIKKAQIDWFQPDVFYNHSAFCDNDFAKKYILNSNLIKVCWYSFIHEYPPDLEEYDIRITLHKPFIEYWRKLGLNGYELQPAFVRKWNDYNSIEKDIDLLFYGQTLSAIFEKRNRLIEKLIPLHRNFHIQFHLTVQETSRPLLNIPFFRNSFKQVSPSKEVQGMAFSPIYGQTLYETIGRSKFTLNGYGNFNQNFKSNMRIFEALGCGSLLISEEGNYPEGFENGKNYIAYKNPKDVKKMFPSLMKNFEKIRENMQPHIQNIMNFYSKENQWKKFKEIVLDFKK